MDKKAQCVLKYIHFSVTIFNHSTENNNNNNFCVPMNKAHLRTTPSSSRTTKTTELWGSWKILRYYRWQIFFWSKKKCHKVQSISISPPLNKGMAALQMVHVQNHFNAVSVVQWYNWEKVLKYFRFPHNPKVQLHPKDSYISN